MPYLGNVPAEAYTTTVKDSFSGDGSTVAFTLSQPSTTNDLRVVVENVIQDPTVAYSVSGTTLTFTSAPPTGTNNVYAVNLGPAVQTVVPPDGVTVTDLNAYADGAVAFTANRATSDGAVIDVQKDGTTVGSIGARSGDLGVATGNTGIRFYDASRSILPYDPTVPSEPANVISLGDSGSTFKDLYLSGSVYLGGTGSANALDDYEEGTWTPTFSSATGITYTDQFGYYTKIGRAVTFHFGMLWSAGTSISNTVTGLPFTVGNPSQYYFMSSVYSSYTSYPAGHTNIMAYPNQNQTTITINTNGSGLAGGNPTFATSGSLYATGFYYVNS